MTFDISGPKDDANAVQSAFDWLGRRREGVACASVHREGFCHGEFLERLLPGREGSVRL